MGEPIISAGADYRVLPWLKVSAGLGGGGNMGMFVPISVLFSVFGGTWEMGFTSRDLITYLLDRRPVVSLATGVMRFRL